MATRAPSPFPRWNFRPSPKDAPSRPVSAAEQSACDTASDSLPSFDGQDSSLKCLKQQALHNDSWITVSTSHDLDLERGSFEDAKAISTSTDRACEPLIPGSKFQPVKECGLDRSECSEQSLLRLCSNDVLMDSRSTASLDGRPVEAPWFENSARNLGQWVNEDRLESFTLNESSFSLRNRRAGDSRRDSRKLPSALRSAGRSLSDVSARRRKSAHAPGRKSLSLFHHEAKDASKDCESSPHKRELSPRHDARRDLQKVEKVPPPYVGLSTTKASDSGPPRSGQASASRESKTVQKKKKKRSKSVWTPACFER